MSRSRVGCSLLVVPIVGLSVLAAGCGDSKMPSVASVGTSTTRSEAPDTTGRRLSATQRPTSHVIALLDEWAACERTHGNPTQSDPSIDAHWVIQITYPPIALRRGQSRHLIPTGGPETATGTCGKYLASAQTALRAAHPVHDSKGPSQATYLSYVTCMRANGVPNYPYPEQDDPTKTSFIGTGVNPNTRLSSRSTICAARS